MLSEHCSDFDEFVGKVRGVDSLMMLQNLTRRRWALSAANVSGIRGEGLNKLMATHPPLEERIARLQTNA